MYLIVISFCSRFKMRTQFVILELLAILVAVCGRPQELLNTHLRPPEPPLQTHFRYNSKSLVFPTYERFYAPFNTYTSPLQEMYDARNSVRLFHKQTNNKLNINKNPIKIDIKKSNITKNNISNLKNTTKMVTYHRVSTSTPKTKTTSTSNGYYSYIIHYTKNNKVRPVLIQQTKQPYSDNYNNWFELKLKAPSKKSKPNTTPAKNYDSQNIGTSTNYDSYTTDKYSSISSPTSSYPFTSNNHFLSNTVTLSPEAVSISQGTHTLAGPEDNPCNAIHITTNLFNKQACPEFDITINNHVYTESNVYIDDQNAEYDEVNSDDYPTEDPNEEEINEEDIPEEDPVQEEVVPEEPVPEDAVVAEDAISAPPSQSAEPINAVSNPGGSSGNRPGLPSLPSVGSGEDDDDGIFGSDGLFSWVGAINSFNLPLVGLLAAPLTILFTGALGISTFFLPWTVFPTLFLSRKAKKIEYKPSRPSLYHPDGWFWHKKYKTWVNMNKKKESEPRIDKSQDWAINVLRWIEEFSRKYNAYNNKSWKRRKK